MGIHVVLTIYNALLNVTQLECKSRVKKKLKSSNMTTHHTVIRTHVGLRLSIRQTRDAMKKLANRNNKIPNPQMTNGISRYLSRFYNLIPAKLS